MWKGISASVRLFLLLAGCVFAEEGALRIYADPAAADALEDMGKYPLFINLAGADLVVEDIGAVGDGGVAEQADGNDALLEVQGLVFTGHELGKLLVAGGDVAVGGHVDKERGKHEFEAVLVAGVDGIGPVVFDLLEFLHLGSDVGCHRRDAESQRHGPDPLDRRGWTLGKNGAGGKKKNRKAEGTTSHMRRKLPLFDFSAYPAPWTSRRGLGERPNREVGSQIPAK